MGIFIPVGHTRVDGLDQSAVLNTKVSIRVNKFRGKPHDFLPLQNEKTRNLSGFNRFSCISKAPAS